MGPRTRRAAGSAAIIIWLIAYIALVVELAARLPLTAWWSQLLFYAVAGVAWAPPLRPLLGWMTRPVSQGETP
ncbi:MAG: DUF2842 domain-containing protein [Caulobacterales bacterium]|nr:DUF2842 domain-containing protein [Caulobacterales bacterium]